MAKTAKPYKVHFVCQDNAFRSRLAAAYFGTLVDDNFSVTSSGIEAHTSSPDAEIAEETAKIQQLNLNTARHGTQTTTELLADADIVVFTDKSTYDGAMKLCDFDTRKSLVWHIPDHAKQGASVEQSEQARIDVATDIFRKIRRLCKDLQSYLTKTAWADVVDAHNEPTGMRLPVAWITDRGLWYRGIHVVAQTIDSKYIVGKRSNDIVFAPGMLEISLGGGVDSGEHPLRAAARETHEELGVRVPEKQFRPLFMYKQIGYHPRYNKQTRCHLYVYAVKLPVYSKDLIPEPGEVAELRTLSRRQIKHLLHAHRMQHFGRLKWDYKLYDKAVAYSTLPI